MSDDMHFDSFDELLDAYLASPDSDDPRKLAEWVRKYPAFGRDLTEFALTRARLDALPEPEDDPEEEEEIARRGMEVVRDLLGRRAPKAKQAAPVKDLLAEAAARGFNARGLAAELRLTLPLVTRLHRRLIRFSSIPERLLAELAEILGRETQAVAAYLQRPATLQLGLNYKSEAPPTVGEAENFLAALRADPRLSPEDLRYWEEHAGETQ